MTYRICIPTYRRSNPLCLKLLDNDDKIQLHFYVRKAEYESGFYDMIESIYGEQIVFHLISDDTKDLGDTRQQILESCIDDDIDYCVMSDDSVCKIERLTSIGFQTKTEQTILDAIEMMQNDKYADNVVDFAFVKYSSMNEDGSEDILDRSYVIDNYFPTFPCQCHIFDVKKIAKAKIKYHSLEECGFEDASFLGDIIKAGMIVIGRKNFIFTSLYANKLKSGGSHSLDDLATLQRRYDKCNKMSLDYLKLDGISIERRYRSYVGGILSLIHWDFDFYREVLVYKRHLNQEVIAKHLSSY